MAASSSSRVRHPDGPTRLRSGVERADGPGVTLVTHGPGTLPGAAQPPAQDAGVRAHLRALVELAGSDLHCKVGSPPRVRIDGRLRRLRAALGEPDEPPGASPSSSPARPAVGDHEQPASVPEEKS